MRRRRKRKVYLNIFFNVVAMVSTVISLLFCVYIFKLDMIPNKYLNTFLIALIIIYVFLLILTLPRKMKTKIKSVCCIFFIIFGTIFGLGIKYVYKTISFIDLINNELSQKEEYYAMVLKDSAIKSRKELTGKKLGLYATNLGMKNEIINSLGENINAQMIDYSDVIAMFDDLKSKKIDGVIINSSTKNLLSSDLSYMKLELRNIHTIMVSIEQISVVKAVDVTNTPFNIYIAGGDAYGSINKVTNTDVNMVISVDPQKRKLLLTSIPRDYYVNLPSKGKKAYDKLTHAGYYGIAESIQAVENLLDTNINYYLKVNFSTIEGVIDAIGGVEIYSEKAFCAYGCPWICYKEGNNYLNGHFALMYARERHAYSDGDIHRVKNQQQVLKAVIDKMTSTTTLITNYLDILDSVKESFSTNMNPKNISRLVKMQLNDMRRWKIESQNLIGTDLYTKGTYTFPKLNLYVMQQNRASVKIASEKIKSFLGELKD